MKTYIIDLDVLTSEVFRSLIGFILSRGINFRKIDLFSSGRIGQSLVIEVIGKAEETLLKAFLKELNIASPIIVSDNGAAKLDGKKLGTFCQVKTTEGLASFYLDKTSGKKFAIQGGI